MTDVKKDVRALLRRAERAGFTVDRSRRHYKVTSPAGVVVGVSRSPSDTLALKRIRHDLRKAGLE